MSSPKKIRFVLFSLLVFELVAGIQWGIHRGLSSLFAKQILSITSFTQIGFIVSIFGVSKAITNLIFGAISDRTGRKPVIIVGIILTGIGGAVIGSSTGPSNRLGHGVVSTCCIWRVINRHVSRWGILRELWATIPFLLFNNIFRSWSS